MDLRILGFSAGGMTSIAQQMQQQQEEGTPVTLAQTTFMDAFSNALETGKFKASEFFGSLLTGFAKITTF